MKPAIAHAVFLALCLSAAFALASLIGCRDVVTPHQVAGFVRDCTDVPDLFSTNGIVPAWSPQGDRVAAFIAFDPDGRFAYGLYLTDLASRQWRRVVPWNAFIQPYTLDWNPVDDRLLVSTFPPGAAIIDLRDDSVTWLSDADGERIFSARWSPEGDSIWYRRTGGMFVMAATGGRPRLFRAFEPGFRPNGWSFSQDGLRIAFANLSENATTSYAPSEEICVVNRDGSGLKQLTTLGGVASEPRWIHDGREILFDWVDTTCVLTARSPEHTWLAVDPATRRVRTLGQYLGTARYQFSFPAGIDRHGERAAVVGKGRATNSAAEVGVLFWTPIERPLLQRLFRPGSPQAP